MTHLYHIELTTQYVRPFIELIEWWESYSTNGEQPRIDEEVGSQIKAASWIHKSI